MAGSRNRASSINPPIFNPDVRIFHPNMTMDGSNPRMFGPKFHFFGPKMTLDESNFHKFGSFVVSFGVTFEAFHPTEPLSSRKSAILSPQR
jgi:hypothetical protein